MWEGLPEPVQVVWRRAAVPVEEVELDPEAGDVAQLLYARFKAGQYWMDLGQAPLLRIYIAYDRAQERWLLMHLQHHITMDHATRQMMQEEIEAHLLGKADELPAPLPFRNFVAQARLGVSEQEHENYFRQLLGDLEEPTAPFGLMKVRNDGTGIEEERLQVDAELARRVRERARKLEVSTASLFHVAWAQVLAKISGHEDVTFGTLLVGRMQGGTGSDRAMGVFINTLPVRLRVDEQESEVVVRRAHRQLSELLWHEHASLALAQRCSAVSSPMPLFSALLNYRHGRVDEQARSEERKRAREGTQVLYIEERTNYPCTVSVDDAAEGFWLTAQVQSPIEPMRICEYMHTALASLTDALERAPGSAIGRLAVLSAKERQQLLYEWNDTATEFPADKCVHELFEEQAARTPNAVAVVFERGELSYAQLNTRANRLAHYLRTAGVAPGDAVAILLERSVDTVVAEIAILKCGAAYVPIDPAYSEERNAFLISDCEARAVLVYKETALPRGLSAVRIDLDSVVLDEEATANLDTQLDGEALAYVMYTSGSTGQPKGVMVPHRAITRLVWNSNYAQFRKQDRVAFAANPAFDASTLEVWAPLLNGGCMVIIGQDTLLDPVRFGRALEQQAVSILWLTVGLFNQYAPVLREQLARLHYLIIGGDVLDPAVVARVLSSHAPQHLLNGYGPTETTTFAATYEITSVREDGSSIPIGRPLANTRIYILDAYGEPAPVGVPGELYIGGAGVARGYLNRPELTAEKFLKDPFTNDPHARMYRMGDLGRWLADGNIEFLGRNDFQVKI
jgi:amino acid adenylation domain-containing protein